MTHRAPIAPFHRGMRMKLMDNSMCSIGKTYYANEVVEASENTKSDNLERAKRWADEARLDLTDEALGQLVAGKLRLAHAQGVSSGAYPLAQGHRLLNCFRQTRHRRSPV